MLALDGQSFSVPVGPRGVEGNPGCYGGPPAACLPQAGTGSSESAFGYGGESYLFSDDVLCWRGHVDGLHYQRPRLLRRPVAPASAIPPESVEGGAG